MVHPLTASSQVVSHKLGRDPWLKGIIWLNDFWLAPPKQRYWQNSEIANIGLDSMSIRRSQVQIPLK